MKTKERLYQEDAIKLNDYNWARSFFYFTIGLLVLSMFAVVCCWLYFGTK